LHHKAVLGASRGVFKGVSGGFQGDFQGGTTVITAKVLSANVLSRQPSHGHRIMTLLVVSANYAAAKGAEQDEEKGESRSCRGQTGPKTVFVFYQVLPFGFVCNFTSISANTNLQPL